jgi:uncharacterized protein YecE (DUF72 family)
MNLFVGTSGYAYKEWKGSFYPKDLPAKQMLHFYGERFGAVEINGSFYRMPTTSTLEGWASEVPVGFQFAFKADGAVLRGYGRAQKAAGTVALWAAAEHEEGCEAAEGLSEAAAAKAAGGV